MSLAVLRVCGMQVDGYFNTTFEDDEEARTYARAARAVMFMAPEKCQAETLLLRDYVLAAELAVGTDMEIALRRVMVMYSCVAPARILSAVIDHFDTLNPDKSVPCSCDHDHDHNRDDY